MPRRIVACLPGSAAALFLATALAADTPPALLLEGGTIHTGNPAQPRAEAVLAIGQRIAFVGNSASARSRAPAGTRIVDLDGATVFPGLTDSHSHLSGIG